MKTEILKYTEQNPSLDVLEKKAQEKIDNADLFIEKGIPQTEAFTDRNQEECANHCNSQEGFLKIIAAHNLVAQNHLKNS